MSNSSNYSQSSDSNNIPAFLSKADQTRTVIGGESNFVGDISIRAGQDLHIEGCVLGNVFHGGKVVVADSGIVIGSIFAAHLEIHGVVDAPDGEILAANLVVHGTSRINASEVTVAAGCMNYERGGFMSAQMSMLSEADVNTRIETLLGKELDRAKERRAAIEQTRHAALELRAARAAVAHPAPAVAVAAAAPAVVQDIEVSPTIHAAAPVVAELAAAPASFVAAAPHVASRPTIALVPAIVDGEADEVAESVESAEKVRAFGG